MNLTVNPVDDPPRFAVSPIVKADAAVNAAYSGTIAGTATDVDGDALTYRKLSGPAWLNVAADGTLSGIPGSGDTGANSWTLEVAGGNNTAQATLAININAVTIQPVVITFVSQAAEDGWVREKAESANVGGRVNTRGNGTKAIRVGDNRGDQQYVSILSFNTASIPDGAAILSAKLQLTRGKNSGTSPLTTHGPCFTDIKSGSFSNNPALQNGDFEAPADAVVGEIPTSGGNGTVHDLAISSNAISNVNTKGHTQFPAVLR